MAKAPVKGKPLKQGSELSVLTFTNHDELHALTPMNFKVPLQFHREFKIYAAQHDMSMVDLLQESFRLMKVHHKR